MDALASTRKGIAILTVEWDDDVPPPAVYVSYQLSVGWGCVLERPDSQADSMPVYEEPLEPPSCYPRLQPPDEPPPPL